MGFFRGLIWELLKYLALGISIIISGYGVYKILPFFGETESAFWWLLVVGASLFIASSTITLYFVHKISKLIGKSPFAFADKMLGSIFGGFRACLFIVFLYSGLMLVTMNQKPQWLENSILIAPLDKGNAFVQNMFYKFASPKIKKIFKLDQLNELMKMVQ